MALVISVAASRMVRGPQLGWFICSTWLLTPSGQPALMHMVVVPGFPGGRREGRHLCLHCHATVLLAKASHMVKPRVISGVVYKRGWIL